MLQNANAAMIPDDVQHWLTATFDGLDVSRTWGETAFFYNPGRRFSRGAYFSTIKEADGPNDRASGLDRPDAWRLNFGLPKPEFTALFGALPARPAKGGIVDGPWTFTTPDSLMPHPVYGWMGWVAVVSPSAATFDTLKPLLGASYDRAKAGFAKRVARG